MAHLNGLPDFEILANMNGEQVFVTFPLWEANGTFKLLRQKGAAWTVLDGPNQWND